MTMNMNVIVTMTMTVTMTRTMSLTTTIITTIILSVGWPGEFLRDFCWGGQSTALLGARALDKLKGYVGFCANAVRYSIALRRFTGKNETFAYL